MTNRYILGALCLILGWGTGTILHECSHALIAAILGYETSFGAMTLTSGSIFVTGEILPLHGVLIASAGSIGIIAVGLILVYKSKCVECIMVGYIILVRGWVDMLPMTSLDGSYVMSSSTTLLGTAGAVLCIGILLVEICVSGRALITVIERGIKYDL